MDEAAADDLPADLRQLLLRWSTAPPTQEACTAAPAASLEVTPNPTGNHSTSSNQGLWIIKAAETSLDQLFSNQLSFQSPQHS